MCPTIDPSILKSLVEVGVGFVVGFVFAVEVLGVSGLVFVFLFWSWVFCSIMSLIILSRFVAVCLAVVSVMWYPSVSSLVIVG